MLRPLRRALVLLVCLALVFPTRVPQAGDLNAEVNQMFNDLGAIGNYSAPGAFRGQTYNTYAGGSLFMRSPNKVYQLAAIQFPSAKAGCGGIDVFGGSFSHISAAEFKNMLKNITAALPGIAFQLALEAVSPLLGSMTKWGKSLETMINNARIGSCETATALVRSAAEATGYTSEQGCIKIALMTGLEVDVEAAKKRCKTDRPSILASARTSSDPEVRAQAPFVGNLTWMALKKLPALTDTEREMMMSMLGTVIYFPEEANRAPQVLSAKLTSIRGLLYGDAALAAGDVQLQMYRCDSGEYVECKDVSLDPTYRHTPFTVRVEGLMQNIATSITSKVAIANPSAEVGLVNTTSLPIYRLLAVATAIPGSSLANTMIDQYKEVVAADYAYTFMARSLTIGLDALEEQYMLDPQQRTTIAEMRKVARDRLSELAKEKANGEAKLQSLSAVATDLERLERQLRTSMPQHVMEMLGHAAVR